MRQAQTKATWNFLSSLNWNSNHVRWCNWDGLWWIFLFIFILVYQFHTSGTLHRVDLMNGKVFQSMIGIMVECSREGDRHFAHNSWGGRKEDYGENLGFSTKWISTIKNNIRGHFPTPVVRQLYSGSGRIYKGNSMTTMKKKLQKNHIVWERQGGIKGQDGTQKKSLMPLSLLFFSFNNLQITLANWQNIFHNDKTEAE